MLRLPSRVQRDSFIGQDFLPGLTAAWQVSRYDRDPPWFRITSHHILFFIFSSLIYSIQNKKQLCWKSYLIEHCFINFNIMFHVLKCEVGILVLNTCIDT